jgi:hypothetical protein
VVGALPALIKGASEQFSAQLNLGAVFADEDAGFGDTLRYVLRDARTGAAPSYAILDCGVTASSSCSLSGVAPHLAGTHTMSIHAYDAANATATASVALHVVPELSYRAVLGAWR